MFTKDGIIFIDLPYSHFLFFKPEEWLKDKEK